MATLGEIIFWTMITLIVIFAALIILILGVTLSGTPVEVQSSEKKPIANYGDDHLLSCFQPSKSGAQLTKVKVLWVKEGLPGVVYSYSDGEADLQEQNKAFKGRTQLFPDAVISGNGSLLLRSIRRSDSGTYTCSITSSIGKGTINIHLRTAAFSAPEFTLSTDTLTAKASWWFPRPNVTWQDMEGEELSAQTNITYAAAGTFAVASSLTPVGINQFYTCTISNDWVTSVSTATIRASGVSVKMYMNFDAAPLLASSPQLTFILCLLCLLYAYLDT